jgi:hypothetical protein
LLEDAAGDDDGMRLVFRLIAVGLAMVSAVSFAVIAQAASGDLTGRASVIDGDTIEIHGQRVHGIAAAAASTPMTLPIRRARRWRVMPSPLRISARRPAYVGAHCRMDDRVIAVPLDHRRQVKVAPPIARQAMNRERVAVFGQGG